MNRATRALARFAPPLLLLFAPAAAGASSPVEDPTAPGVRTNGKVIASAPGAGEYSCSGTAIDTPSRSIVLTAGHCVVERGVQAKRITFVPAYDHGKRPFRTFTAKSVFVMPQWRRHENPGFDLAALRVRPNALGYLTDVVGGRGYAIARWRRARFQIFGYPAARARGEEMRVCRAHGLGADGWTNYFFGPPTMPASCDMAAGASGGGWLFNGEYVAGVTGYAYQGRPSRLFSPYFGREIGSFLKGLP
jgi:V8-like Glu-specific endopeptidase